MEEKKQHYVKHTKHKPKNGIIPRPPVHKTLLLQKTSDEYRKFTHLDLDLKGSYVVIPEMDLALIIPPGAVEEPVRLKINILRNFSKRFPKTHYKWKIHGPRVRLEPHIKYKKPVYLIMNHDLVLEDTQGKYQDRILKLLHRNHDDEEWTEIIGFSNSRDERWLKTCEDKAAILTKNSIVVQMRTNCEFCFAEYRDELGVSLKQILRVDAYADYQDVGSALDVRVYGLRNLNHRAVDVDNFERERFGGHFIGRSTVFILDENPLDLTVTVCFDRNHEEPQSNHEQITYNAIQLELAHSPGEAPYKTFPFYTNSKDVAAPPPHSVLISVKASQHGHDETTIRKTMDLLHLEQNQRQYVSTTLSLETTPHSMPRNAEARSYSMEMNEHYKEMKTILMEELSNVDVNKLKCALFVDLGTLPYPQMKEIVIDFVIKNQTPEEVLAFLEQSEVRRDEIRERFERFFGRE